MEDNTQLQVSIPIREGAGHSPGNLTLPEDAKGLVIFAHGSGSSRRSPRNRMVARSLVEKGLGTLLFDLLTEKEASNRANVFDIPLLAGRVVDALRWAGDQERLSGLSLGLFGSSTGAAAALVAAARAPASVSAVVSRGGRPDLAGDMLPRVKAATLLVVGGADFGVIELNEDAFARLTCEKRLETVPGATHLFEEPGTLEAVVELAGAWFLSHFQRAGEGP